MKTFLSLSLAKNTSYLSLNAASVPNRASFRTKTTPQHFQRANAGYGNFTSEIKDRKELKEDLKEKTKEQKRKPEERNEGLKGTVEELKQDLHETTKELKEDLKEKAEELKEKIKTKEPKKDSKKTRKAASDQTDAPRGKKKVDEITKHPESQTGG